MREYTAEYGKSEEAESIDPRAGLIPLIEERNLPRLLRISAQLHGHFCPGLSLGVMAAVEGLHGFAELIGLSVSDLMKAEGLEELLAIVETNNCMTDGVQAVSGCSFGNNGLIFHDLGKTALTLGNRTGRGLRLTAGNDYRSIIDREVPAFTPSFEEVVSAHGRDPEKVRRFKAVSAEASFAVLKASSEIFSFEEVELDVPGYAEMQENRVCSRCGETVMAGRAVEIGGRPGMAGS
ncbi:MAG: FmdE family protein, partial [Spirochaetaceae bacterium]